MESARPHRGCGQLLDGGLSMGVLKRAKPKSVNDLCAEALDFNDNLKYTTIGRGLFVDSQPRIGYSGDLARCCAWSLCVVTRTRLVDAPGGGRLEQATGCSMRGI